MQPTPTEAAAAAIVRALQIIEAACLEKEGPRIGKRNAYICEKCKHRTVTRDAAAYGITPFMIGCTQDGCNATATSSFYRVPQGLPYTHEWYRPVRDEIEAHISSADCAWLDHVAAGGLILRNVKGV